MKKFMLLLSVAFLTSCASTQVVEEPVTNLNVRYEFDMFSVLPPQGENWFLLVSKERAHQALLMFGKQVKPGVPLGTKSFQPHTIRAGVTAVRADKEMDSPQEFQSPQKFLDFIKQSEQENTSGRFNIVQETYTPYKKLGDYCVLIDMQSEDTGVPSDPGKMYIFNGKKLYCYDKNIKVFAMVSCSQRAPSKGSVINIDDECGQFIDSFKFKQ
jgi:hypothetical protein